MSACTPSRLNLEGHPERMNPRNGNYGRGFGDYFRYRRVLTDWLEGGDCDGLGARRRVGRAGSAAGTVTSAVCAKGQPVAVVTGGGGGIGAAIAEELGRNGIFVVTMDPLVSVDGAEQLPPAAGDDSRADRGGRGVGPVLDRLGSPTATPSVCCSPRWPMSSEGWTRCGERRRHHPSDQLRPWRRGRLAQRAPSPPRRVPQRPGRGPAPHGRGWAGDTSWASPPAPVGGRLDTGAYGCAKRAVASLTWQLGRQAPARGGDQRHLAHRHDPHGDRRPRPARCEPDGTQPTEAGRRALLVDRWPLPRFDACAGAARAPRRPPRRRRGSRPAGARCSSPPAQRSPSSASPG